MKLSKEEREHKIEELVKEIQAGNDARIPELWELLESLCAWYCRRIYRQMPPSFLLEYEDLHNCGYIALCETLKRFDPEKSGRFSYVYLFYLTGAIYRENALDTGGRTKDGRRRFDPAISGDSLRLDAKTDEADEKEGTLYDVLADGKLCPSAFDAIADRTERIFLEQLRAALESLMNKLPRDERILIREKYYAEKDRVSIAKELRISRDAAARLEDEAMIDLRRLAEEAGLEQFLESQVNYYAGVGVKRFKESGASSTEKLAIRRMDLEARYQRLIAGDD